MSLIEALKEPCPWHASLKGKLVRAALFGSFVVLFLIIFQPFDLDAFSTGKLIRVALCYGAIAFGCVASTMVVIPKFFPQTFNEKVWTTGRQIAFTIFIVFVIGLVNFLLSPGLVHTPLNISRAIWFQGVTLAVAVLPISVFILVRQNQLLQKFKKEAAAIEEQLRIKLKAAEKMAPVEKLSPSHMILFTSDYQSDELEIPVQNLYLVTSANNYIKIYFLQDGRLIYSILRSTMKKAEETTLPFSGLFRCHRAFIINLDKVTHVEGNAQGYKLRIQDYEELIPVSRNLSAEFSDRLLAYRNSLK